MKKPSDPQQLDAFRAKRREIQRRHYRKYHPEQKVGLQPLVRLERLVQRIPECGCWLWLGAVNRDGYGKVKVKRAHLPAHRWSWNLHRGLIPDGLQVLHRCDVPGCVNPAHLFLGTNQDNVDDRQRKGRGHVMPIHREARLTSEQVMEARRLRGFESQISIGKRLGVHPSHVSRIQRGKYWKHLPVTA